MIKSLPAQDDADAPQSLDAIFARHVDMLYRVCFSYMKNAADAEDVVEDVFVKLLKCGKTFRSVEQEKAWLLRTAINRCKDCLKHWWHGRADLSDYGHLEGDVSFCEDETLKRVLELPARYKAVIYLYYYEGYSSAEIAKILKKPRSTVLNHMSEARKYLKGVLENEE
jgi:RNA polymerase sigma-70 factor (ECF subfamily)